jgi:hypothetical protein
LRSPTRCEKSLRVPTPRGWDGEFESFSLQRRVGCELPSNQGIFENYRMEFEKLQRQKQTPGFGFAFGLNE